MEHPVYLNKLAKELKYEKNVPTISKCKSNNKEIYVTFTKDVHIPILKYLIRSL